MTRTQLEAVHDALTNLAGGDEFCVELTIFGDGSGTLDRIRCGSAIIDVYDDFDDCAELVRVLENAGVELDPEATQ